MENFTYEVQIDSTAPELYMALTTQKGLVAWWTPDIDIYPHVGGILTVNFSKKMYMVMKITKLMPNKEVVWKCVEQYLNIPGTKKTDEWLGTTIKFTIKTNKDDTISLVLIHTGLTKEMESFQSSKESWELFLRSLKKYVEKGKGYPHRSFI